MMPIPMSRNIPGEAARSADGGSAPFRTMPPERMAHCHTPAIHLLAPRFPYDDPKDLTHG